MQLSFSYRLHFGCVNWECHHIRASQTSKSQWCILQNR